MRLSEMLVDLQRFERSGPRPGVALLGRAVRIQRHENVRVRQSGVGDGVRRVDPDRAIEMVQGLYERILVALVPIVPPSEIELLGLGVDRPRIRDAPLLTRSKLHVDPLGDIATHLTLHGQNVPSIAVVGLRPEVPVLCSIDELNLDPHPVAGSENGALDDPLHAQLSRDFGKGLVGALVTHGGGAGDHLERLDRCEIGDQLIRQAVGKVLLSGIARQVGQRKHRKRSDAGPGGSVPDRPGPANRLRNQDYRHQGRQDRGGVDAQAPPVPAHAPDDRTRAWLQHMERGAHFTREPVSLAWFLGEATLDDGLESGMHAVGQRRRRVLENRAAQFRDRSSVERKGARGHGVQNDAQGPDIALGRRTLSLQDLRTQVRRRAHDHAGRCGCGTQELGRAFLLRYFAFGQAKIQNDRPAVLRDDHVVRLEVSMDDPPAMGVLEGLGDLRPDSNEGFEGVPVGRDALRQRAAVEKLHGDVDVVVRGWLRRDDVRASLRSLDRAVSLWTVSAGRSFKAMSRSRCSSCALKTTPIPPAPSLPRMW